MYIKLPGLKKEKINQGCLNCGYVEQIAPMDLRVCVGFGSAYVTKDKDVFYESPHDAEWDSCLSLTELEAIANNYPESDWRVHLHGPLHGEVYQRQDVAKWVLIESDKGFA